MAQPQERDQAPSDEAVEWDPRRAEQVFRAWDRRIVTDDEARDTLRRDCGWPLKTNEEARAQLAVPVVAPDQDPSMNGGVIHEF